MGSKLTNVNAALKLDNLDLYIITDDYIYSYPSQKLFGIRQDIITVSDDENAQYKARFTLNENCNPKETISLQVLGTDLTYRVGWGVLLNIPILKEYASCFMYIKSVKRTWKNDKVAITTLELTPSRVMDEQEWSDINDSSNSDETSDSTDSELWNKIYSLLKQQLGKAYVWGHKGPDDFDCSGLVMYCYNQFSSETGITMGGNTYSQCKQGKEVDKSNRDKWQPGDLLFWIGDGSYPAPSHVSVYIGDNQMIHARGKQYGVVQTDASRTDIYCVRRVIPESSGDSSLDTYSGIDLPTEYVNKVKSYCELAVPTTIKNLSSFKSELIKVCKEQGVAPYLMLAIIAEESQGITTAKSGAGAYGLCQIMPNSTNGENIYTVEGNIRAGCKIYKNNLSYMGSGCKSYVALACYGAGAGNVEKWLSKNNKKANSISVKEMADISEFDETKYAIIRILYCEKLLKAKKALG